MTELVKPWTIVSTKQELSGNTGVTYKASKVTFLTATKTRTIVMQQYLSIPPGADIDAEIFSDLQRMDWL